MNLKERLTRIFQELQNAKNPITKKGLDDVIFDCSMVITDDAVTDSLGKALAHFLRGYAYLRRGENRTNPESQDIENAVNDFNRNLELTPSYYITYMYRAKAHFLQGHMQDAVNDATVAIEKGDGLLDARNIRANAYANLGEIEKAKRDFRKAIRLAPNNYGIYASRGLFYMRCKQYDNAIEDFTRAIQINPSEAAYHEFLGRAYELNKDLINAEKMYKHALALIDSIPNEQKNRFAYEIAIRCEKKLRDMEIDIVERYGEISLQRGILTHQEIAKIKIGNVA